jgi:hypothetical protein
MKRLAILVLAAFVAAACSPRPKGPGPMRIVAGNGSEGFADGIGGAARFRKPCRSSTTRGWERARLRAWVMNQAIHHRARLGVYLRLLDVPVPGLYGPREDEQ